MTHTQRSPEQYLRGTHLRIAAVMDAPMTIDDLAQRLALPYEAIASTLRGMHARREVVKLKPKDAGKPYRWKLRGAA
jgi:hypothetical protein